MKFIDQTYLQSARRFMKHCANSFSRAIYEYESVAYKQALMGFVKYQNSGYGLGRVLV
ncbi:hypothetical protein WMO40_12120 [Bacillaceae bacterium CLA-AA-H227]|uniref:Uncharacterized protein n=1 Tax=Robertmurraya yapensis (ex Hitch et al 2024) TaxID=3133160 RepID=A0ACC6SC43_9BACI